MSHVRFASNCLRPRKPGPQRSSRRQVWAAILSFSIPAPRARRNSGWRGVGRKWPTGCSMTGRLRCVLTGGKSRMEQEHIAQIKAHLQHPIDRSLRKARPAFPRGAPPAGSTARHDRFGADASGGGVRHAAGRSFRSDQSLPLASAGDARNDLAGGQSRPTDQFSSRKRRPVR